MLCRHQDGDSVILEHVQEGRFACIVESEKENLGMLVHQPQRGEDIVAVEGTM